MFAGVQGSGLEGFRGWGFRVEVSVVSGFRGLWAPYGLTILGGLGVAPFPCTSMQGIHCLLREVDIRESIVEAGYLLYLGLSQQNLPF